MIKHYILQGKEIKVIDDVFAWAESYESTRPIRQIHIKDAYISTIFLGLDHRFYGEGAPILFETMIFGGEHNQYQERYCTYDEALEGHLRACKKVLDNQKSTI